MKVWTKHFKNGLGSGARIQRNHYAFNVMLVMTGGKAECPCCSAPFNAGDFEVDRINGSETDADGSEVYREGTIVYICTGCNQDRALLQNVGRDWPHAAEYKSDVIAASSSVTVASVNEARRWWSTRPSAPKRTNKYA